MGNPSYRSFGLRAAAFIRATASRSNTFTDTGDLVTHNAHGLTNGTVVVFQTITTTTGLTAFVQYYVIGATTNTFQVSATYGGSAVALTTDGSGTYKALLDYPVYLPNKAAIEPKTNTFTFEGADQSIESSQTLGYNLTLDSDSVALALDIGLFDKTAYTANLPDGYTSLVYGGDSVERAGVAAGFWMEGTATRIDATTGAETNVYVRRTFPVGRVMKVAPAGQNTGTKNDLEQYKFAASKTSVDLAGGALPATVPTGGIFYYTMEKAQ